MSETTIEITVSGDNAEETLAQIAAQLPETAEIIAESALPPTLGELFANGVAASPELPARVSEWVASLEMNPFLVLLICGAIFTAAYVLERILRAKVLARILAPEQADRPGPARIGAALRWGFVHILGLFVFYSIAWVATASVLPGMEQARTLAGVALGAVMIARVWYVILAFLAAPKDPSRRPTGLEDHEAKRIMRLAIWLVVVLFVMELSRGIVLVAVDAGVSGALFVVMTRLIGGVAVTAFLIAIREPVRKLILLGWARDPSEPGMLVKFLSRFWHVFYIVLYLLQMAAEARGYLAGTFLSDAGSIKRSFSALVLLPFALAGLVIWRRQLRARSEREDSGIMEGLLALAEGALIIATSIFVLYSWDIDPFATDLQGPHRIVPGLVRRQPGFRYCRFSLLFLPRPAAGRYAGGFRCGSGLDAGYQA